jgi:VWFA-related protein
MKEHPAYFAVCALLTSFALAQGEAVKTEQDGHVSADSAARAQIHVPNRPTAPLFQGEQERQKTEIYFDPTTQIVTIKMLVQDSKGCFIPNIRRENFAVYENGVRQQNATVEIEHAAVSVGLLLEYGGRYQALNETVGETVSMAANQFLDEVGRDDNVAIWKYGDTIEEISGFARGHDTVQGALLSLPTPPFSEVNFYDALIAALARVQDLNGRKALIVISSGLDTFSKASYQDALQAVRRSGIPIYAINIGPAVRRHASLSSSAGPYARLDWKRAESELRQIAGASGGRMYAPQSTVDLSEVYDDLMENLRVRYVITYKSKSDSDGNGARTVRIELVDSRTGGPLRIVDANGRPVRSKIIVEDSYVPRRTPAAGLNKRTEWGVTDPHASYASINDIAMVVESDSPAASTNTPAFSLKSPENPAESVMPCQGSMQINCAPGLVQTPR